MMKNFLREAVITIAGKQAEEISNLLDKEKYVNEFKIAKKLGVTINQTRNMLYKMSDYGLVSSIRKKDKRKGWYTYFWKIESLKSLEYLRNILIKKIEQIENQIKNRENRNFYLCERCDLEFNEENALIRNFTCDECGGVFAVKDKAKILKDLRKESDKLKRELKSIDGEILKEKEKTEKKRARELKKEKKAKEKKRKRMKIKKKKIKIKKKKKTQRKKQKKKKIKRKRR